jgi:hypothetical protein
VISPRYHEAILRACRDYTGRQAVRVRKKDFHLCSCCCFLCHPPRESRLRPSEILGHSSELEMMLTRSTSKE